MKKGLIWNEFLLIINIAEYSGKKTMQKSEGWYGEKYENKYENKKKKQSAEFKSCIINTADSAWNSNGRLADFFGIGTE